VAEIETANGVIGLKKTTGIPLFEHILVRCLNVILLLSACFLFFFVGLHSGDLCRTEGLRAMVARTMLETGDWVVPRLYDEPFFTKPPGFYLAVVLCSLPCGRVTEFTARLPSAVAATICVVLFAWYVGRHLGRASGLAAGFILPVSPLWLEKGSAAEIDMMQVAWVTGSILFCLRATEEDGKHAWGWWLASSACVAGGFLTKWTGPLIFYFFALPFLALRGRSRLLLKGPHLLGLALTNLGCAAWVIAAVHRSGFDDIWRTVAQESLPRFIPAYYQQPFAPGEALLYPFRLWLGLLPWSLPALIALKPGFAARLEPGARRLLLAFHCWAWPSLAFWMLTNEHTLRHSLPLTPAFAGFAVLCWHAWYSGRLPWRFAWLTPGRLLAAVCVVWLMVKIGVVTVAVPYRAAERQVRRKAEALADLVPAGTTLHHASWNRDEPLFFYYGRSLRRFRSITQGSRTGETTIWFLNATDGMPPSARLLGQLCDEGGKPALVVEMPPLTSQVPGPHHQQE
jgi:4-amino-4-deoxy-L-arabinose transferase-like glycosyltransferase